MEEDCSLHLNQNPSAAISDEEWTRRITALYEAKLLIYFRWLQGRYGDPELAMDAIQSAFVRILSVPEGKRADIRAIEAWAFAIVQNQARMLLRSHISRRENLMGLTAKEDGDLPTLAALPDTGAEGDLEGIAQTRENCRQVMDAKKTLTELVEALRDGSG